MVIMSPAKKALLVVSFVVLCACLYDITSHQNAYSAVCLRAIMDQQSIEMDAATFQGDVDRIQARGVVMAERRLQLLNACRKRQNEQHRLTNSTLKVLYYSKKVDSLYCAIPKIGSTFWKRVLTVVDKDLNKSPLSMSGPDIHSRMEGLSFRRLKSDTQDHILGQSLKFMFTRNPYKRVFSAYCDKCFMVGEQPITEAIVDNFRPWVSGTRSKRNYMLNTMNVTFSESIQYAIGTKNVDPHFKQASSICSPCSVSYDLIGQMESFQEDSEYILQFWNRSKLIHQSNDFDFENDASIIRDLCQRTFQRFQNILNPKGKPDVEMTSISLRRFWKVLQIRGLISNSQKFPFSLKDIHKKINETQFRAAAVEALQQSESKAARKAQQSEYFYQAFRSVPLGILRNFKKSFSKDFELFGYDPEPSDIFGGRTEGDVEFNLFSHDGFILDF